MKPRIAEESNDKSKIWKLTEISEPSQCRSSRLQENLRVTKVLFTNLPSNRGNYIWVLCECPFHNVIHIAEQPFQVDMILSECPVNLS